MTSQYRDEKLAEAKKEYSDAEFAFKNAASKHDKHVAEDGLLFWSKQINYFQNASITADLDWDSIYKTEDAARA
jgi:hypothetical protein